MQVRAKTVSIYNNYTLTNRYPYDCPMHSVRTHSTSSLGSTICWSKVANPCQGAIPSNNKEPSELFTIPSGNCHCKKGQVNRMMLYIAYLSSCPTPLGNNMYHPQESLYSSDHECNRPSSIVYHKQDVLGSLFDFFSCMLTNALSLLHINNITDWYMHIYMHIYMHTVVSYNRY